MVQAEDVVGDVSTFRARVDDPGDQRDRADAQPGNFKHENFDVSEPIFCAAENLEFMALDIKLEKVAGPSV